MATVSGSIVLPAGAILPEGATWTVAIQDTSMADAPATTIAEVTADVADLTASEVPFEVSYDPALIDQAATYTLHVVIEDGSPAMLFVNDTAVPVITGGAPTTGLAVDVIAVTGPLAETSPLAEMSPLAMETAAT